MLSVILISQKEFIGMLSVILTMNMNMSMLCLWLYAYHKGSSISIDLGLLVVQQERKGGKSWKISWKSCQCNAHLFCCKCSVLSDKPAVLDACPFSSFLLACMMMLFNHVVACLLMLFWFLDVAQVLLLLGCCLVTHNCCCCLVTHK